MFQHLVDEGTIYDIISLRIKNKKLLGDLLEITKSLGYNCSDIKNFIDWKGTKVYGFNISTYSYDNLLLDINGLSESFPTCDLAHKQKDLDFLVSPGRSTAAKRKHGETKNFIVSSLTDKPKTVMEISREIGVCRRTSREHLEDLKNMNKVKLIGLKRRAKLWAVNNENTNPTRSGE